MRSGRSTSWTSAPPRLPRYSILFSSPWASSFTYEIAANIYTAVLTDTGSFRYDSTTKRAFSICEEMTEFGVTRLPGVAAAVYESHPKERYHLLCLVLAHP